jgi:hypothetical protein
MIALASAVLTASLLGSAHCAGMCGPFCGVAVSPSLNGRPLARTNTRAKSPLLPHAAYHGGRLLTYLSLGLLAGLLGKTIDLSGSALGLARVSAFVAGAVMILLGAQALVRRGQTKAPTIPMPAACRRGLRSLLARATAMPPLLRAGLIGSVTTLLPCGWLYAFVITAAGTGDPRAALVIMAAFWLGTIPMLLLLGAGVHLASSRLSRWLPRATALLLIAAGLWSISGRLSIPRHPAQPDAGTDPRAHVDLIASSGPTCCQTH